MQMRATCETARLQAWNRRVEPLLGENLSPIALRVRMRTEFSGVCTAEESMYAAASIYNAKCSCESDKIHVVCESMGDWYSAARHACSLNHTCVCVALGTSWSWHRRH